MSVHLYILSEVKFVNSSQSTVRVKKLKGASSLTKHQRKQIKRAAKMLNGII